MAGVVDADTHVLEHEGMWENFDDGGNLYPYRPLLINLPPDTSWGARNAFWLIDGEMYPKSAGRNTFPLHTPTTAIAEMERTDISLGARQMTGLADRLADMDERGVEVQVVYPTLFLFLGIPNARLEAAVCRAYNNFMTSACARSERRMRFVAVLPLYSPDAAIAEMNRAREAGAVGLFFRTSEAGRQLADPYFSPVYIEAARLGLPICIHAGRAMVSLSGGPATATGAAEAFTALVSGKIPERFPDLKIGFIEFGSMWIPQAVHSVARRTNMRYKGPTSSFLAAGRADRELFRDYRIFVTCFADDDLPWVLQYTGEENLLIGSDYSHQDASEEIHLVEQLRGREDLASGVAEKILNENPRQFYAL